MSDEDRQRDYEPEHPSAERALELLKVISQPVRWKIMRTLALREPMRVSDVATAIGEPANSVSYHLRQLARVGIAHTTEPATGHDLRETWWVIDGWTGLSIEPSQIRGMPGGDVVLAALDRMELSDVADLFSMARVEAAEASGRPGMRNDGPLLLTTGEAQELVDAVHRLLRDATAASHRHREDGDEEVGVYDYRVVILPAPDEAVTDPRTRRRP